MREVEAIAVASMRKEWAGLRGDSRLADLASAVADGELDPYSAADRLLDA